jgi:hypothetical protein
MGTSRGIRAGAAYVEIFTDDSAFVRGLRNASRKFKAFGAGLSSVGAGAADLGARIMAVGTAAVAGFGAAGKTFANMGEQLTKMSQRTGVSVESLSELGYAASQSGIEMDAVEKSLRLMQKAVVAAAKGSKKAGDALAYLGLSVADLDGLAPEDQFKLIGDRLSKVADPTIRAASAMAVFGRSGTAILPMLARGAAGINELQAEARRLGLTISTTDAAAGEKLNDTFERVWMMVRRAIFGIGAAIGPVLMDVLARIQEVVAEGMRWVNANRALIASVLKLAVGVAAVGAGLLVAGKILAYSFGAIVSGLGAAMGIASTVLGAVGAAVGFLLSPIGLVTAAVVGLGAYIVWSTGAAGKAVDWLGRLFGTLKDDALAAWQGITAALAAGDIALAAKILWLALKLEWQKGVAALAPIWYNAKADLLSGITDIWAGVGSYFELVCAGMKITWAETVNLFETTWAAFCGAAQLAWAEFRSLFDKGFDLKVARAAIIKETDQAIQKSDRFASSRRVGARLSRDENLAGIAKGAQTKRWDHADEAKAGITQTEADLAAAQNDLSDALGQAQTARYAKEFEQYMEQNQAPDITAPKYGGLADLGETIKRTIGVRGTFSAAEAAYMGAGGGTDRLVAAAEKTAANTDRLVALTEADEMTYGD